MCYKCINRAKQNIFYFPFRKGEACSHIAALLFAIDDYISKGLKDLPEDRASTEKLCQWNKPAKRKAEPKTIHKIRIVM